MDISARYRKNVRTFYAWIGSMVLLGIGPIVGEKLINGGSQTERILGVVIAMLAWVPWIYIVIGMIRHGDEFVLRVHLVALSFAFLGIMIALAALDWLTRADFIEPPPFAFVWAGGLLLWFVGILTANHYYQRGS
jgi:hypothetical protein